MLAYNCSELEIRDQSHRHKLSSSICLAKFPVQFVSSPPPSLSAVTAEFVSPHGEVKVPANRESFE